MTTSSRTAQRSTPRGGGRFDHRDSGNPAEAWRTLLDGLPEGRLPDVDTPIIALAAHPDDETLGCGGILAEAARRGHPVTVIIATDGEASHPESPTHTPDMLARIRRREAAEAVSLLAPGSRLVQLGLPDGQLDRAGAALRAALVDAACGGGALLLSTWEQDRHPDHAACARAARQVAATHPGCLVAEYPIWAWHWADPAGSDLPRAAMTKIPVGTDAVARRRTALHSYRSQVLPLSDRRGDEAVVGPHVTAHFDRPYDVLIDPRGCAGGSEYFSALYAASDDPWGSASRWYERRKRALLLAGLPRERFAAAFEPGCGPGHLTVELGRRCDTVLAVDAASTAVALAAAATAGMPGISVQQLDVRRHWPAMTFDLVVLSEIGYYFADLESLSDRLTAHLRGDAVVVLCHWRHPAVEHLQSAEAVHEAIRRRSRLHPIAEHREQDFLLDVLTVSGTSVARADGILD